MYHLLLLLFSLPLPALALALAGRRVVDGFGCLEDERVAAVCEYAYNSPVQ